MRFGIFDHMEFSTETLAQLYEERLRMLEYADEAGFYCYHKAEHHFTPLDAAPSPSIFLAAASQRTSRIRLGSMVHLLPFYEPLRFIEEVCMLDHLCGGRLEVGVGKGISPAEHTLWGRDPKTARRRFEEAFEIVRIGLAKKRPESEIKGSAASYYADDNYVLESASAQYLSTGSAENVPRPLRPLQNPQPGWWYPGNVSYAGKHRLNTIAGGPASSIIKAMEIFRNGLEQPDADWNSGVAAPMIGAQRHIYLAATEEGALERARRAYLSHHQYLTKLWYQYDVPVDHIDPTMGGNFDLAIARDALLVGSPETAVELIKSVSAETGIEYLTYAFAWGDLTHEEIMTSMGLFVREVMPEFNS